MSDKELHRTAEHRADKNRMKLDNANHKRVKQNQTHQHQDKTEQNTRAQGKSAQNRAEQVQQDTTEHCWAECRVEMNETKSEHPAEQHSMDKISHPDITTGQGCQR